ncbi:hypothetical protein ACH4SP_34130 [Streptomyces sp. NPDC021093]|uniref:hypothetical protein n=1 Tax=Streptomyces sp. NPDC021093 TaxID=3365112 RepID=UPI0037B7935C
MATEELTAVRAASSAAATEAEARAAFLSRAGGPALAARTVRDRAAELLPDRVDAASDIETVLTELAARATMRARATVLPAPADPATPATPTVWGLDLSTGALRQVRVPASGPPAGVAAGLTWVSALESGLAQHCESLLARGLGTPGTRVPRLRLAEERHAVPDALLRALHTEGEPVAHDLTELLSLPACALTLVPHAEPNPPTERNSPTEPIPRTEPAPAADHAPDPERDTRDTVVATGATLAEAVRTATERALSRRRAREAGRPVPHAFPAVGREQESDAPRPQPCVQWSHPLDALRSQGHSPVAVLLDHEAPVSGELPYLVRIVLSAK